MVSPHKRPVRQKCFRLMTSMIICVASSDDKDDLIHKSHKAPVPYPITHHFVTEIFLCFRCPCTYLHPPIHPHPSQPLPPLPTKAYAMLVPNFAKKSIFYWEARIREIQKKKGSFSGMSPRKGVIFCMYLFPFVCSAFELLCINTFDL